MSNPNAKNGVITPETCFRGKWPGQPSGAPPANRSANRPGKQPGNRSANRSANRSDKLPDLRPGLPPGEPSPLYSMWLQSIAPYLWWAYILPFLGVAWVQKVYEQAILLGDNDLLYLMVNLFGDMPDNYRKSIRPLPWIQIPLQGFQAYPEGWYASTDDRYEFTCKWPPGSVIARLHMLATLGRDHQFVTLCERALREAGDHLWHILFPSHLPANSTTSRQDLKTYMCPDSICIAAIREGAAAVLIYMLGQLPPHCYVNPRHLLAAAAYFGQTVIIQALLAHFRLGWRSALGWILLGASAGQKPQVVSWALSMCRDPPREISLNIPKDESKSGHYSWLKPQFAFELAFSDISVPIPTGFDIGGCRIEPPYWVATHTLAISFNGGSVGFVGEDPYNQFTDLGTPLKGRVRAYFTGGVEGENASTYEVEANNVHIAAVVMSDGEGRRHLKMRKKVYGLTGADGVFRPYMVIEPERLGFYAPGSADPVVWVGISDSKPAYTSSIMA